MTAHHEATETAIVGGGQSGLAMSRLLTELNRDHLVIERSDAVGTTWAQRWDSFTLVTPNAHLQLPRQPYDGEDPHGFLARDEVVEHLQEYAQGFEPPLRTGVEVTALGRDDERGRYVLQTTGPQVAADNVVVTAGTFQHPRVPDASRDVPAGIAQLHSSEYRNPGSLPDGGVLVVGSGQSGCQIARELHESGRPLHLCVSGAGRLPRRYRDRDGMWWAEQLGLMDQTVDDLESPAERFAPNPHVSGRNGGEDVNLHVFAREGITLLGRLREVRGRRVVLAEDLHDNLAAADAFARKLRAGADAFVERSGMGLPTEEVDEPDDGFAQEPLSELDLHDAGIGTIIWATGYGWDYGWVDLPVLDDVGYPVQDRGVTDQPGLYFLGLHWLHTRKSGLFLGVGGDAEHVAAHLAAR